MIRISKFNNPARGGRTVETTVLDRHTTVMQPNGICEETHRLHWKDIGTLMNPVENHVQEQPTNKWKQRLIDAQRGARA